MEQLRPKVYVESETYGWDEYLDFAMAAGVCEVDWEDRISLSRTMKELGLGEKKAV